ncbi:MAG: fibro-slime domain-containing protein [Oscillospiraceae bacterium]|nr:fibro-slime domain-containing protein [Oscillospiraceae bacterium]
MKRKKLGKNRFASCCLALLLVLSTIAVTVLPDCDILPKVSAADDTVPPVTEQEPLAWFEFDNGIQNMLNNGVNADIVNEPADQSSLYGTDGTTSYLDLNNKNAYLSLTNFDGSGVLAGMAEVAVEMRIKTQTADTTQWVFYAGSSNNPPSTQPEQDERYLSVHLDNNATKAVVRRYNIIRPNGPPSSGGLSANLGGAGWYTLKVVYEAGKTTLSVKDNNGTENVVFDTYLSANVWECVGDILWFGYSGWGKSEYFNGCIDYIKVWGTPNDGANVRNNAAAVENRHIITEKVVDPENTVVNMFDYWVIGDQGSLDYGLGNRDIADLINGGINKGHLFLFDGSASISQGDSKQLGQWNLYDPTPTNGKESNWGIVQKRLYNGYPRLALDNWSLPTDVTFYTILQGLWDTPGKKDEPLDYLFDPEIIPEDGGKASYPNVTGLFRINDNGYYYFHSQEVFAELNANQATLPKTSQSDNKITLYDTPWREEYARGQFFPFNDWTSLFYEVNGNIGQRGDQTDQRTKFGQPMNHWFGMSIETEFMQMSGDTDMTFEFSGDDDVWIFIDDILVADVGGNHSRIRVTINFSTGEIEYLKGLEYDGINGVAFDDPRGKTTLRAMFEDAFNAGALSADEFANMKWRDNATFADGTMHTLKFFYLERGNAASNCNISFNLQNPIVDRIRKVDQNGDPLEGAEFALYEAITNSTFNGSKQWHTSDEFMERGAPITTAISNRYGYATLTNSKGEPLTFNKDTYYILKETKTPAGYRSNPPIVLKYHENTKTLTVVNKYEAGAYASFVSDWTYSSDVYLANYNHNNDGKFSKDNTALTDQQLTNGLAIVVPVIKSKDTPAKWYPMYGSNTLGWNTVQPTSNSQNDLIKALAEAAFMQISDTDPRTQHWYLNWDGARLRGQMENLPGDATRYVFNGGSDGELVTLFLSGDALKALGLTNTYANDDERYKALSAALAKKDAKECVALVADDLKLLYTGDNNFYKNNRTVIYVPNEQRELWVHKVDEDGAPVNGAEFALFKSPEDAAAGGTTTPVAFGTTDENGMMVFRADAGNQAGYAQMNWDYGRAYNQTVVYWLKEIAAPEGYELNESLIRVEVNDAGVYANATGFDPNGNLLTGDAADNDGIKVEASLGRLTQTLVKYAEGIVDETLKNITATKQTSNSSNNGAISSWTDANGAADSKHLAYDKANGYGSVKFEAENGYIRVMLRQTQGITSSAAKRDNLNGVDLDGLLSLINTVVVTDTTVSITDPSISTGSLTVTKKVVVSEGDKIDSSAEFAFTVTLSDKTFEHTYSFTNGKTVSFDGGVAKFTLRHGESVTFTGLPADVTYKVDEEKAEGYTADSTGATGTIVAGKVAEAMFINTKIEKSESSTPESSDSEETDQKPDEPSESSKTSTSKDNPNTGFEVGLSVGLIIMMLSLIAIITAVIMRRKRGRHQK